MSCEPIAILTDRTPGLGWTIEVYPDRTIVTVSAGGPCAVCWHVPGPPYAPDYLPHLIRVGDAIDRPRILLMPSGSIHLTLHDFPLSCLELRHTNPDSGRWFYEKVRTWLSERKEARNATNR